MASSLLALLDDIATILDDVSVLTQVAAKKTAGVLGDDLALNAQQVSGVAAARELPVVWAVARGSLVNKAILVPAALAISAFISWAVTPLMMIGGAFLCYEGFEKLAHRWLHRGTEDAHRKQPAQAVADPAVDLVALEKEKIRGAVRTDFILSAEIIVISLGTVAAAPLPQRIAVLVGIALIMTVGVYGLVAGIVKLDDAGLHLHRSSGDSALDGFKRATGGTILRAAPYLMKVLSVAGTAAMFLVGGGILAHGVPPLHHAAQVVAEAAGPLRAVASLVADGVIGIAAGALALAAVSGVQRLRGAAGAGWLTGTGRASVASSRARPSTGRSR